MARIDIASIEPAGRTRVRRLSMLLAGVLLLVNLLCAVHAYEQAAHPGDALCDLCVHASMLGHAVSPDTANAPVPVRAAHRVPSHPGLPSTACARRPRARAPPG